MFTRFYWYIANLAVLSKDWLGHLERIHVQRRSPFCGPPAVAKVSCRGMLGVVVWRATGWRTLLYVLYYKGKYFTLLCVISGAASGQGLGFSVHFRSSSTYVDMLSSFVCYHCDVISIKSQSSYVCEKKSSRNLSYPTRLFLILILTNPPTVQHKLLHSVICPRGTGWRF